ncbi:MAG: hypothetical protein N2558_02365 [Patescibacteria group bacterium]|nr:hypothetical protein [Patescibacteria group bacterium]
MKIPFIFTPDKPLKVASQELVPVIDITDGIAFYKNGGAAIVMESTSLNFGLLSENEQEAVIVSYAGLLNSLSFPIQITVSSQKKDISSYMKYLEEKQKEIKNEKLAQIMMDYKNFINEAIKKRNILSKKFYITIPFYPYELGLAKNSFALSMFSPNQKKGVALIPYPKSYVVRKAKISLHPKRDHLIRQANRLSIKLKQLNDEELLKLFYNVYNPEVPVKTAEDDF